MGRARKPPKPRRKRDYKSEYQRRQTKARAAGFASYYEFRTRPAPNAPKPPTDVLNRLRGHAGRVDFLDYIRDGDLVTLADEIGTIEVDSRGRFRSFQKLVIPADDRPERVFTIRNQTRASLARLIQQEIERGAVLTPQPSYDQRRLLNEDERKENEL